MGGGSKHQPVAGSSRKRHLGPGRRRELGLVQAHSLPVQQALLRLVRLARRNGQDPDLCQPLPFVVQPRRVGLYPHVWLSRQDRHQQCNQERRVAGGCAVESDHQEAQVSLIERGERSEPSEPSERSEASEASERAKRANERSERAGQTSEARLLYVMPSSRVKRESLLQK